MADYTQPQDPPADSVTTVPSSPADPTLDPDRPVSTIPADSTASVSDLSQSPADSQTPIPAESPSQPAADSAKVGPTQADSPSPVAPPSDIPSDPSIPSVPSEPPVPSSLPEAASGGNIQDSLPPDQPIQVQPEAPVSAPSPQSSPALETPPESAGIKPEPLEGTQNAPSADSDSPKSSFGDIIYGTGRPDAPSQTIPPPIAPVPSPTSPVSSPPTVPKTTFGDLGAKPPAEKPTINIEPMEAPKPVQPTPSAQPPVSPSSPQSPLPSVASAKEGLSDQSVSRRQKSLQVRKQKHEANITKVLELLGKKTKVKNTDVRDYLHVSQTTATDYLHTLVKQGKIKKEGKGKATEYTL